MSRQIKYAELQEHKSENDLWLLIDGKVYDVTKFISEHPGGDEVLITEGGRDATEPYEDVGHSEDAYDILKTLLIGEISDPENIPKRGRKPSDTATASAGGPYVHPSLLTSSPLTVILAIAAVGAFLAYRYYF
ncbi:hypothetical protein MCUN1_000279 [Malassezia cuniculi]|uniref:Cytochrome b5 heme-binding domain-containing protein n=1 Tax=Malassezia cuniculi TaxID=948313 RepID=A0AAF0J9M5_9BASI|nr:hypothetical protein MCUN1_000279 [Malassezia cuniculi]